MTKSNNSGRSGSVPPGGEEEKKMNKKLLGSLILGVMLCTPLMGAHAAGLTEGAIYGNGDKYGKYRTEDNGNFTYDFLGDSTLTVDGSIDSNGVINRRDSGVLGITIKNQLDIKVENVGKVATLNGITISNGFIGNPAENQFIVRGAGGSITVASTNAESLYDYPDNWPLEGAPAAALYGASITGGNGNTIDLGDSAITVTAKDANMKVALQGLYIVDNVGLGCTENKIIMGNGEINIIGNVISGNAISRKLNTMQGIGMMAVGEENIINTGNVSITVDMTGNENTEKISNSGIEAYDGGKVCTGNGDITVNGQGGEEVYSYGISAARGQRIQGSQVIQGSQGTVTKTGGHIEVVAEGKGTLQAYGVRAIGGTINITGSTDITAKTIGGKTATSVGLFGLSTGTINYAGGTITAYSDNEDAYVVAVQAQSETNININKDTKNKVVINGNVNNVGTGAIYLNLNTADSVLNGRVSDANGTFNLENGAQWNVLGTSTVNDFHMKNGIIHMDRNYDVNIASYSGSGTISFLAEDEAADGVANFENVGDVTIKEAEKGASVTLGIANNKIDTLDLEKTEENLNALAKKISYTANDGNLIGKAVIREGLITPEARGDLVFGTDGSSVTNITGGNRTTETMYAMKNLAATAIVAWRQEDSTLSQRLGELRESTGGQGIWVRMSRGEFEYSGEYKNQYNFFQLGYDWAADNWHYGVAVSHNDGETAYTYGSGENRSTSLSLYGTWLGDAGHYADIVLKQGRLSNDFDVYTSAGHTSGDYDAWGTSLSGEYGRKFVLEDDWYITPQAQLTLMRIGGESYGTNNGIGVRQDTLYSAVGRLGFEVGKKVDNKGSVYAKASVLHDFAGNAETYLTYNDIMNSYSQDLSDTWFEAGIGFNYKISDSSYVYADVVRTFGGDVETPWQWNIGMRWSC